MSRRTVQRRLLARLALGRGKAVPHGAIITAMYGSSDNEPENADGVLTVMICQLRKRGWRIGNVHGVGYCMPPDECERVEAELGQIDGRILVPIEICSAAYG
jgi:DNA-binding response OmpR family regulator